jgi:hypothetical protein
MLARQRGDFEPIGRVADLKPLKPGVAATGRAGIMIRTSLDPGARGAWVWLEGDAVRSTAREQEGKSAITFNNVSQKDATWLRIVRAGDVIGIWASTDPRDWGRVLRSVVIADLPPELLVGAAVASREAGNGRQASAAFEGLAVRPFAVRHVTSWIGNTWGGAHNRTHVPMHLNAMALHEPSGTVAILSVWDEGGPNLAVFDADGKLLLDTSPQRPAEAAGGWGVAIDGDSVYTIAYVGKKRGIKRFDYRGHDKPFAGGNAFVGMPTDKFPRGLALDSTRHELHVALEAEKSILVYDSRDPGKGILRRWQTPAPPRAIAVDGDGNLWAILVDDPRSQRIVRFSPDGAPQLSIAGVGFPMSLTVRGNGDLLVCDAGQQAQDVKIYTAADIRAAAGRADKTLRAPSRTFGEPGGIHSGVAGAAGPLKLAAPAGAGIDDPGRVYVGGNILHRWADFAADPPGLTTKVAGNGMTSGAHLRRYSDATSSARIEWERFGIEGMSAADFVPGSDGAVLYSREHRYTLDHAHPAGQEWTCAALTHDPDTYPHDLRLVDNTGYLPGGVQVRQVDGRTLLFIRDQRYYKMMVYRFQKGSEIAIPAAALVPWTSADNRWPPNRPADLGDKNFMWIDTSGDGQMQPPEYGKLNVNLDYSRFNIDTAGGIWIASNRMNRIHHWRLQGLSEHGVPRYGDAQSYPVPAEFNSIGMVWYDAASDELYVIGYSKRAPNVKENSATTIGTELACYASFTTAPRLRWQRAVPFAPHEGGHGRVATEIAGLTPDYAVCHRIRHRGVPHLLPRQRRSCHQPPARPGGRLQVRPGRHALVRRRHPAPRRRNPHHPRGERRRKNAPAPLAAAVNSCALHSAEARPCGLFGHSDQMTYREPRQPTPVQADPAGRAEAPVLLLPPRADQIPRAAGQGEHRLRVVQQNLADIAVVGVAGVCRQLEVPTRIKCHVLIDQRVSGRDELGSYRRHARLPVQPRRIGIGRHGDVPGVDPGLGDIGRGTGTAQPDGLVRDFEEPQIGLQRQRPSLFVHHVRVVDRAANEDAAIVAVLPAELGGATGGGKVRLSRGDLVEQREEWHGDVASPRRSVGHLARARAKGARKRAVGGLLTQEERRE